MWCAAWLHQRTIWLVLTVPAINPQTLVLSRRAHFILVKDASSAPCGNGTAGASSTWQSRSRSLRRSSAAVALIHCSSRETGPVGDIQGLSWVPPSHLRRSVFGGLNWKRENDVRGRYSVVKHNDPAPLLFSTAFSLLRYFIVFMFLHLSQFYTRLPLSCLHRFLACFNSLNTNICLCPCSKYSFLYVYCKCPAPNNRFRPTGRALYQHSWKNAF